MTIADILLEKEYIVEETKSSLTESKVNSNAKINKRFIGTYFSPRSYNYREIKIIDDSLRYYMPEYDDYFNLIPKSKNELIVQTSYDEFILELNKEGIKLIVEENSYQYQKVEKQNFSEVELNDLIGDYYNPAFKLLFSISKNSKGKLSILIDSKPFDLHQIDVNRFVSNSNTHKLLKLNRNISNQITGISITNEGYKEVLFQKINLLE